MKYAIGIDLGTCNSATTRLHESGHSVMIQNADGKALTPSVVNFSDGGEVYFGEGLSSMRLKIPFRALSGIWGQIRLGRYEKVSIIQLS